MQPVIAGQANAVIQGRGPSTNDQYKSFQIRTETLTTDEAELASGVADEQGRVDAAVGGYNRAVRRLYGPGTPSEWKEQILLARFASNK